MQSSTDKDDNRIDQLSFTVHRKKRASGARPALSRDYAIQNASFFNGCSHCCEVNGFVPAISRFSERFEPLEKLGESAIGAVYKVREITTNRIFAVRILHSSLNADSGVRKTFRQTMELVSSLDHPAIASVYGASRDTSHATALNLHRSSGEPEKSEYVLMEYIDAEPLDRFLSRRDNLTIRQRLSVFNQVLEAVDYAHSMDIIHRDIKPGNVLILENSDGSLSVKLVDFAVAGVLDSSWRDRLAPGRADETSDAMATAYMSPERCLLEKQDISSDVYSLGCLLYFLLKGKAPFLGKTAAQTIARHFFAAPPSIGASRQEFRLQKVFNKCIEKRAGDRYQSIAPLRSDIESIISGRSPLNTMVFRASAKTRLIALACQGLALASLICGGLFLGGPGSVEAKPAAAAEDLRIKPEKQARYLAFKRSVNSDPNSLKALISLANSELEQGRLEEAGKHIVRALHLQADNPAAWLAACRLADKQGSLPDSYETVQKALELNPENKEVRQYLYGIADSIPFSKLKPHAIKVLLDAGLSQGEIKSVAHARQIFEQLASLEPNNPRAWIVLCNILRYRCEWMELEQCLPQAISLDPENKQLLEHKRMLEPRALCGMCD